MPTTTEPRPIVRDEDWEFRWELTRENDAGRAAAIPADTVVTAWLSATHKGSAMAGTIVSLAPRARQLVRWVGPLPAANVTAALASLPDGTIIHEVVAFPSERRSRELVIGS